MEVLESFMNHKVRDNFVVVKSKTCESPMAVRKTRSVGTKSGRDVSLKRAGVNSRCNMVSWGENYLFSGRYDPLNVAGLTPGILSFAEG